ncbi:unnamed protein product [Moneuplotes crassus]|uniref:Uncharacterized protein n=1 Tax=Euplotes crassus TaxID=5936 RepID=A0AAD1XJ72_EUPCR|nr:unnamed protein product [Moneuplotes crassus]
MLLSESMLLLMFRAFRLLFKSSDLAKDLIKFSQLCNFLSSLSFSLVSLKSQVISKRVQFSSALDKSGEVIRFNLQPRSSNLSMCLKILNILLRCLVLNWNPLNETSVVILCDIFESAFK